MSVHTAHFGFNVDALRGVLHLPGRPPWGATPVAPSTRAAQARPQGLERLAVWAERQPMHHRLGSYTLYTWVR
jgi:hypothetical protein